MASKNQRPIGKKKVKFYNDPNATRIVSLNGGEYARIYWNGKGYHVKVGSRAFYERLTLIGDRGVQADVLTAAGFDVDAHKDNLNDPTPTTAD